MDDILDIFTEFVLEYIVDPVLSLFLNKSNFRIWAQKPWTIWLMGLLLCLFLLLTVLGWKLKHGILLLIGLLGAGLSGYAFIKYTIWWFRDGRYE